MTDVEGQRLAEPHEDKKYRREHPLEQNFKERIVGQLGSIYALSNAIRRKQNGWHDDERPLVFMFCGPSGVGKTELAKALAEYMHTQREIAEKADFLRQAGPDYKYPNDDICPVTYNKPDDKSKEREKAERHISLSHQFTQSSVYPLLHKHFCRDEFLGRINEILIFLPFNKEEIGQLIHREMMGWEKKARSRHGISITWDAAIIDTLASGYNKLYGARSIKYEIERKVINLISKASENEEILKGGSIHLVAEKTKNTKECICKLIILKKGK